MNAVFVFFYQTADLFEKGCILCLLVLEDIPLTNRFFPPRKANYPRATLSRLVVKLLQGLIHREFASFSASLCYNEPAISEAFIYLWKLSWKSQTVFQINWRPPSVIGPVECEKQRDCLSNRGNMKLPISLSV